MIGKITATLTGPFSIALLVVFLLLSGVGAGLIIADKMNKTDLERRKQSRIAAEIAARGPPKPERVPAPQVAESPFKPRYVVFGEEFTSNFQVPKRVLIVKITLMTQRGDRAYKLLDDNKMLLRALTLATLSEYPLETATATNGVIALSDLLKTTLNNDLNQKTGFSPIDTVIITDFFIQ